MVEVWAMQLTCARWWPNGFRRRKKGITSLLLQSKLRPLQWREPCTSWSAILNLSPHSLRSAKTISRAQETSSNPFQKFTPLPAMRFLSNSKIKLRNLTASFSRPNLSSTQLGERKTGWGQLVTLSKKIRKRSRWRPRSTIARSLSCARPCKMLSRRRN